MFAIDKQGCNRLIRFAYEVKKRPPLFLQEKSLKQLSRLLQGFIYGYNSACDYDLDGFYEATKNRNTWVDFQDYFCKKYNTRSICYLEVIALCGSDERAFDLFFEELEIFLKENNVEIPRID